MATMDRTEARYVAHSRPLILSYWVMPLLAGLAVTLVAAGMLTEVVVLANKIDANVTPIKVATADIQVHAAGISVLDTVDSTAKGIRQAADPLTGQASTILTTVGTIQSTVGTIDQATGSILSNANGIDTTVDSITPHVLLIAEPVEAIVAHLKTTNADLVQALGIVAAARSDLDNVTSGLLPLINDHARSIDCHLAALGGSSDCGNP